MMSTCYLGALSDLVENIFFLGVRLTKQKILPNYLANSILSVCLLYFVSIFKEEEIKSKFIQKPIEIDRNTKSHIQICAHTHVLDIVPQTI